MLGIDAPIHLVLLDVGSPLTRRTEHHETAGCVDWILIWSRIGPGTSQYNNTHTHTHTLTHTDTHTHTQPCLFWRPYFHFFCNTECSGQPSFFPLSPSHTHPHQYHAHVCTHSRLRPLLPLTLPLTHSCSQTQPPLSLLLQHPLVTHTHTHTPPPSPALSLSLSLTPSSSHHLSL